MLCCVPWVPSVGICRIVMGNLNSCNLYALNWHLYIERVQLCRLLDYFNHYIWWWLSLRLSTRWLKHMERHYLPYCCGADKANRNYRVIWPVVHTMPPIIYIWVCFDFFGLGYIIRSYSVCSCNLFSYILRGWFTHLAQWSHSHRVSELTLGILKRDTFIWNILPQWVL